MTADETTRDAAALPYFGLPVRTSGAGFDMLAGTRVLDLTTSIAGPYAAMLLADMGADVVKVERPGTGDDARAWGPPFLDGQSLWFLSVNRNKRSLTLDYSDAEGRAVLHDLVRAADIVLVNHPPRVARKLGTDAATLTALKPGLIYAAITGFGLTGERADWTCYDLIAEGYSGVMDLTGEIDGEPQKVGAPAADMLAGQDAAFAAVAALVARGRTGRGTVIDIALVESMTRFLTCRLVPYLGSGELPRRSGGKDSVIAIYQTFATADEPMTLALGNDAIWQRFWETVGKPDFARDPAYATNADRRSRREDIVAAIQKILLTKPRAAWLALFRAARVPAGPIQRLDDVAADREMQRRGMVFRYVDGNVDVPQVGTGIQIDGAANTPRRPPPALGAHTAQVLGEWLGLTAAETEILARRGLL